MATYPISLQSSTFAGAQDLIMTYCVITRERSNYAQHHGNVLSRASGSGTHELTDDSSEITKQQVQCLVYIFIMKQGCVAFLPCLAEVQLG